MNKQFKVDAFCYGVDPRPDWFNDKVSSNNIITYIGIDKDDTSCYHCLIKSKYKTTVAMHGDYVIRGTDGEVHAVTSGLFKSTYEIQKPTIIENIKSALEKYSWKYVNMESTNNKDGAELLFKIQELTKALNAINGSFVINPFLSESDKEKVFKYKPLENGYYWVKVREFKKWEILKYHNGYFYVFNTGECKVRYEESDIYEIGERIEHK